jgi:hypothetical protein
VREIIRDCANTELIDSAPSKEDEHDRDRDHWQEHGIQPCKGEGDVEQGESDNDDDGGSADGNDDSEDDGEELGVEDLDDQEIEGKEDDFMSF